MSVKTAIIRAMRHLPLRAREAIFHLGFHLAPERFREFAFHHAHAPQMDWGLRGAKARGLEPGAILDIGAYEGAWSEMARRIWPEAKMAMIEGNLDKRAKLAPAAAKIGAELQLELLGPVDGEERVFHVMETGSSVFEEESGLDRREETRRLRALDALFPERSFDLIKIDVQGFELEVLKGAPRLMAAAEAILLEISLIEINKGAPLLHDVLSFMAARGFLAYELLEMHRRPLDGANNQIDILFLREGSPLLAVKAHS